LEWEIPNSWDVKYRIGSITKTFISLAVLQLAEKGKLSIKDKAGKWLPEADIDHQITMKVTKMDI
jgi:CubicO group peptidase (beta-lactamase class C family)